MRRMVGMLAATMLVSFGWTGCGDDESTPPAPTGTGAVGAGGSSSGGTSVGGSSNGGTSVGGSPNGGTSAGGAASGGQGSGGQPADDIPGGGTILFEEHFDDADFDSRGWYDGPGGTIDTSDPAPGSSAAFECRFLQGAQSCSGGKPARHPLTASESVYLAMYLRFSDNWVGSGVAYHPHMFHFINDLDSQWVGPSHTYLTTYTEVVGGRAMLALQDSKNVDLDCILLNNDTFVGCNGDFDSYLFTEERSVCSCNGLLGDLDGRDCFSNGDGTYYSSRAWRTAEPVFTDEAGAYDKREWHLVEVYFEMNSVSNGVGVADGRIRWVQDGEVLLSYDHILMRTGAHASLAFNQFAMLPYVGPGSPVEQSFWVDELVVATARP